MANVYSTRFAAVPGFSGGPLTVYTVPAGYVAVVKDFRIVWGNILASGFDGWFQDDGLTKFIRYSWAFTPSTPSNFGGVLQTWGAVVLEEGTELQVQTVTGEGDFSAAGYLLALP